MKRLFVAILTEIEMGVREWAEDTSRLEQQILMPFPLRKSNNTSVNKGKPSTGGNGAGSGKRGLWFGSSYQRKECVHKEAHSVEVKGEMLVAQHVCASCWLKDRVKVEHPDSSPSCPHFGK